MASDAAVANQITAVSRAWMPLREQALTVRSIQEGSATVELHPRPWMLDRESSVTLGALAIVADDALGLCIAGALPEGSLTVSVQLSIDLLQPIPGHAPLLGHGVVDHLDDTGGLASGTVVDGRDGRVLAVTRLRSLVFTGVAEPPARTAAQEPEVGSRDAIPAAAMHFANPMGVVHGGVLALFAERAAAAASPDRAVVALHVTFVRPVPADDAPLAFSVAPVHAGRRFATSAVTLTGATGVPSLVASAACGPSLSPLPQPNRPGASS